MLACAKWKVNAERDHAFRQKLCYGLLLCGSGLWSFFGRLVAVCMRSQDPAAFGAARIDRANMFLSLHFPNRRDVPILLDGVVRDFLFSHSFLRKIYDFVCLKLVILTHQSDAVQITSQKEICAR